MTTRVSSTIGILMSVLALQAGATTITISDNQWHAFDVDEATSANGGLEWIDITDGSPLNFTITLTDDAILRVVDGGWSGDTFRVLSNGSPLGITPPAPNNVTVEQLPATQAGFDAAWADPSFFSKASYVLSAGTYSITGVLNTSATFDGVGPLNATVGAVMLAPVPEPASALMLLAGLGVVAIRFRAGRRG